MTVNCGVQIRYYMRVYQSAAGCRPSTCPALFRAGHPGRQRRASRRAGARSASALASRLQLQRCMRGGSRRLSAGTTLVPDDGYRLLLGEPGAGGSAYRRGRICGG